jgi:Fe-S-cluster containining protein
VVELRECDRVPDAMVVTHDGVRCMDQRGNGACIALDAATQLCTIYVTRPQTCRDFSRGGGLCRSTLLRPKPRTA